MNNNNGITIAALVVTVIIILILSVVAISAIRGENGLFSKADTSAKEYTDASEREATELENLMSHAIFANGNQNPGGDGNPGSGPSGVSDSDSTLIPDFKPVLVNQGSTYLDISNNLEDDDRANIVGYAYLINDEVKVYTQNLIGGFDNLAMKGRYKVNVIAMDKTGRIKKSADEYFETIDTIYLWKNGREFNYDFAENFIRFNERSGSATMTTDDNLVITATASSSTNNYRGISKKLNLAGKNFKKIYIHVISATTPSAALGLGSVATYFTFTSGKSQTIVNGTEKIYEINIEGLTSATLGIQFYTTSSQKLTISEIWIE